MIQKTEARGWRHKAVGMGRGAYVQRLVTIVRNEREHSRDGGDSQAILVDHRHLGLALALVLRLATQLVVDALPLCIRVLLSVKGDDVMRNVIATDLLEHLVTLALRCDVMRELVVAISVRESESGELL